VLRRVLEGNLSTCTQRVIVLESDDDDNDQYTNCVYANHLLSFNLNLVHQFF